MAEEHLTEVFRDFIKLIKDKIHSNLEIVSTAEIAEVPKPPGVALSEPSLIWNMQKTQKAKVSVQDKDEGTYREYDPPRAYDVECEIMLIARSTPELMSMTQKAIVLFDTHAITELDGMEYPLNLISQFSSSTKPNLTKYHIATGQAQIEGVLVESGDYEEGYLVEQVHFTYTKDGEEVETKSFDEEGTL